LKTSTDALVNEYFPILFQPNANDVDEWPLRVTLEKMCPNLQNCQTQVAWVSEVENTWIISLNALIKIDDRVCLFDDTPDPV
jgi:hypothetical protein